jgi:hypothetical protein
MRAALRALGRILQATLFGVACSLGAAPAADRAIELGVWQLDCSTTQEARLREAVAAASDLLTRRCGVALRLAHLSPLAALPEWCDLPRDRRARLRVEDEFSRRARGQEPQALSLFVLPGTQDGRLSWAEVDLAGRPCGVAADPARSGALFLTDMAFTAIRQHDEDPRNADRPWAAALLAHEVFHAATHARHPTRERPGNLMADGLNNIGVELRPAQCDCLRQSAYVRVITQ